MTKKTPDAQASAMGAEREMQALIGQRLRARYAAVLAEPVPDKLLDLLEKLDRTSGDEDGDRSSSGEGGSPNSPVGPDALMRGEDR